MLKKSERFLLAAGAVLATTLFLLAGSGGYAGVVNSPHDFSLSTGLSTKSTIVAPGGVCSACHIPHNALDNVLWARSLSGSNNYSTLLTYDGNPSGELNYRAGNTLQCYDCHDFHSATGIPASYNNPPFTEFATSHKPQDIAFGFTKVSSGNMTEDGPGGSVSGYYENVPPFSSNYGVDPAMASRADNTLGKTGGHYFKSGNPNAAAGVYKGDKLPCSDCHDPHKWSATPAWQAFFSPRIQTTNSSQWSSVFGSVPASSIVVASENMANPLQAGTRVGNDPNSRRLCTICHGTSTDSVSPGPILSVTFTQINPKYNNPVPTIVRPPVGISEHQTGSTVACVACHKHNTIDASCSMCHGFPPSDTATVPFPSTFTPSPSANDSHPRHVGNKQGEPKNTRGPYAFACGTCHYGSAMGIDSSLAQHQNNRVSVVIQGVYTKQPNGPGGAYDNTNYYNQAYMSGNLPSGSLGQLDNTTGTTGWATGGRAGGDSCRNVYCHSAGRVQASMTLDCTADYPRPAWFTGPLHCNDCHGLGTTTTADPVYTSSYDYGMPNYANQGPGTRANSHYAHVVKNGIECSVCHFNTVTGVGPTRAIKGTTSTPHVNTFRDVAFDTAVVTGSPAYDNVGKACNSVSCHGAGAPVWGQTGLNCFSCHAGVESVAKPQPNQGRPSPVDNAEYLSSGHGRTGSNYPGDSNLPAGFSGVTSNPPQCFVCHSLLSKHIGRGTTEITNDPYRLGSSAIPGKPGGLGNFTGNFADNVDTLCLGCHGNATQRAGHDNAAKGVRTVDAQTHASGISGVKYIWPVTPFKCVDCHDPHGDSNWKMIRSAINAPKTQTDSLAGSNPVGTPKRTTGLDCVVYQSTAGQATSSYASLPTTGQGICEICHNQTFTYKRGGVGALNGHPTTRCSQCHTHPAGFKGASCKGCHGGDDGTGLVINNAPNIAKYWLTSGHGRYSTSAPLAVNTIQCEDCHDISYLSGADHKTSGAAGLTDPPTNTNTLMWPGKTYSVNTNPTLNTAHLKSSFFPASPNRRLDYAWAFDKKCGAVGTGCHTWAYPTSHVGHAHPNSTINPLDNVLTFGKTFANTPPTPKNFAWYPVLGASPDYLNRFYESAAVWLIQDLTTKADNVIYPDNGTSYGTCITCHDPHGSNVPINKLGKTTNMMMRGDIGDTTQAFFCNTVCHGN